MTVCVVHRDHEAEEGWLVCRRAWGRLAGALHQIPRLVEELSGLGFVQRDRRPRLDERKAVAVAYDNAGNPHPVYADPVAHALPAGPLNGSKSAPRVSGTPGRSAPIRIDSTDLLGRPRHGSLSVADRSRWPEDQVGFLSAATVLDFWVRDWADLRGERPPDLNGRERSQRYDQSYGPGHHTVGMTATLAGWLLDRLDWACVHFTALDEFAADVSQLSSALYGLAGYGAARPKLMEAPCPGCHLLTLTQCYEESNIECSAIECGRILTVEEYAEHVRAIIEETIP